MILEALINLFFDFLMSLFDTFHLITLPTDVIEALRNFVVYGGYVVGNDLLILFGTTIFSWVGLKLTVGISLRIWEMLPFT